MKKLQHILFTVVLVSGALGAAAQTLKPGLWEITNKMSSSSGQVEKAMTEAQKQLASMPPEQRRMMEEMMAKQGVGLGQGAGVTAVKVCMTREMVAHDEVITQQGDCKRSNSSRSGNTLKFSFACTKPPSSGEGQVTFVSPQAYTMKMTLNSAASGKPEIMNLDATGKFLSAECGSIKPFSTPGK